MVQCYHTKLILYKLTFQLFENLNIIEMKCLYRGLYINQQLPIIYAQPI